MGSRAEVAAWVAGCTVVAGVALAWENQRTQRQRSELERRLEAGREAQRRGDAEAAARDLASCAEALTTNRATPRARAVVALEAASALEHVPERAADAERYLTEALESGGGESVDARRRRGVLLDRLASLAQSKGDFDKAAALYQEAVLALGGHAGADAPDAPAVAFDVAGVLHNFATCDYQRSGDPARALLVLDQALAFCKVVPHPPQRRACTDNLAAMHAYLGQQRRREDDDGDPRETQKKPPP